jgi:hypothetical protein
MEPVIKDSQIKDKKDSFVSLKAEKLASALYLVSDFLSDAEPLKWQLREKALGVLTAVTTNHWWQALSYIDQLSPLLVIGGNNPAVSASNFSILKDEYQTLRHTITDSNLNFSSYLTLPSPTTVTTPPLTRQHKEALAIAKNDTRSPNPGSPNRQEIILKFIRQQAGWSSIGEIAKSLPGFSSKTVQRELATMVKIGLLKKEGAKRWSRYLAV